MGRELNLPFDPIERAGARWETEFGPSGPMMVATSIMRVQQLLLASFDALLKRYELTFARYEALVLLSFSRDGELPMRVIGERLMVHPTSATNIVDRLVGQGLVTRRRNPTDGRGVLAAITGPGRRVAAEATEELMAAGFGLDALAASERDAVFAALRRVRLAAGDFTDGCSGPGATPPGQRGGVAAPPGDD
ncbi:MarR family transcriptional regulator [Actinocatenispora thailandica]|uniref:MarR family winged helix-turn-helix transcriptional regulator n=1 Tax=Actinocatenispora thailandica TaxID=227318 RepID=UPI0031E251FF